MPLTSVNEIADALYDCQLRAISGLDSGKLLELLPGLHDEARHIYAAIALLHTKDAKPLKTTALVFQGFVDVYEKQLANTIPTNDKLIKLCSKHRALLGKEDEERMREYEQRKGKEPTPQHTATSKPRASEAPPPPLTQAASTKNEGKVSAPPPTSPAASPQVNEGKASAPSLASAEKPRTTPVPIASGPSLPRENVGSIPPLGPAGGEERTHVQPAPAAERRTQSQPAPAAPIKARTPPLVKSKPQQPAPTSVTPPVAPVAPAPPKLRLVPKSPIVAPAKQTRPLAAQPPAHANSGRDASESSEYDSEDDDDETSDQTPAPKPPPQATSAKPPAKKGRAKDSPIENGEPVAPPKKTRGTTKATTSAMSKKGASNPPGTDTARKVKIPRPKRAYVSDGTQYNPPCGACVDAGISCLRPTNGGSCMGCKGSHNTCKYKRVKKGDLPGETTMTDVPAPSPGIQETETGAGEVPVPPSTGDQEQSTTQPRRAAAKRAPRKTVKSVEIIEPDTSTTNARASSTVDTDAISRLEQRLEALEDRVAGELGTMNAVLLRIEGHLSSISRFMDLPINMLAHSPVQSVTLSANTLPGHASQAPAKAGSKRDGDLMNYLIKTPRVPPIEIVTPTPQASQAIDGTPGDHTIPAAPPMTAALSQMPGLSALDRSLSRSPTPTNASPLAPSLMPLASTPPASTSVPSADLLAPPPRRGGRTRSTTPKRKAADEGEANRRGKRART